MHSSRFGQALFVAGLFLWAVAPEVFSQRTFAAELLPPGFRPLPLGVHALVGAKIVQRPGDVLEGGTLLIRDGWIEAVGKDVKIPADARVWEMKGTTVYAGFIDAYLGSASKRRGGRSQDDLARAGAGQGAPKFFGVPGQEEDPGNKGPGYGIARIAPENRMAESYSPDHALIETLHEIGFTDGNVIPESGILRGASAFVALSEANPNEIILKPDVFQHAVFETGGSAYPSSLMGVVAAIRQAFYDADYYRNEQTNWIARPGLRERPEYNPSLEALSSIREKKRRVVLDPGSALMIDRAGALAREFGFEFLLLSTGQEWRRPELARRSGAGFIVPVNFPELAKLSSDDDWDDYSLDALRRWDWAPENPALLRQAGLEVALTSYGLPDRKVFRKKLRAALDRGLSENDALAALTTVPAKFCGLENVLGTIEPGKLAHLTVVNGESYFDPANVVREVWIDGRRIPGIEPAKKEEKKKEENKKEENKKEKDDKRVAHSPQENRGPLASPKSLLITNAAIWTCGSAGRIEEGFLFLTDGKVVQVGPTADWKVPDTAPELTIDGAGKHLTPGLIDAHSHAMILGGVNESTLPSTAMVRIRDVINSETENIYEELAGGLTVANLLHGSANPIGGQNAIIKLKDGALPEDLLVADAPPGIKFALGENVKQSNWGERNSSRFPQTRMGVRTFFANRFTAAQEYLAAWEAYRKNGGKAPRRNLELEALGEIIQGKRQIHCHSYRQDEILSFLRVMESFGVRVATLQHVLEGYKVADEIARHGAGASGFSDWWAYKFEVYDAIPYNGSLMRERGVLVSFNSDDSDLARRLYLEAAKAVKYGNTPEVEALKFVTLNPAKQLGIDRRVGSLEKGKDGDFVLWSKSPLDSATVCLQTWIEGKKYFDRDAAPARAEAREKERAALIQKAKKRSQAEPVDEKKKDEPMKPALEHEHDGENRHCED